MYTGHMDAGSFLLYIALGLFTGFIINRTIRIESKCLEKKEVINKNFNLYIGCWLLVLLFFATFRKVDYYIGGMDMIGYLENFKNIIDTKPPEGLFSESLFYYYTLTVASFTSNEVIYMAISYFVILLGYVMFIKTYMPNNISSIPFVMIIFPFLKSFNTLSTGLAVAVFLMGLALKKKSKWIGCIFIISTFFIHRMSILFVLYIPFNFVYEKYVNMGKNQKRRVLGITILCIVSAYYAAEYVKEVVLSLGILDVTDRWYLTRSSYFSIFERWPMFFAQAMLLGAMILWNKKIRDDDRVNEIKKLCVFDFIIVPISLVLGMWRANEYLYLARLIMWGEIITVSSNRFTTKSRFVYRWGCFAGVIIWLCYRIYAEWDELKIMPYILELF